jgi:hypothetical protein
MQIDFSIAQLQQLSLHEVGNPQQGEQLYITQEAINPIHDDLAEILMHFFLKPFSQPIFQRFSEASGEFSSNPIHMIASDIFANADSFHENSIRIAKHLFECTRHPGIIGGDLYVFFINNCRLNEQQCDAIGIFKSEQKSPFVISQRKGKAYKIGYERGIDINKPDKGCIIFNIDAQEGYKVCSFDRNAKGNDARFWAEDFLQIKAVSDSYHMTQQFLSVAKTFVAEKLPESFDVSKTEQIDLLNRSVSYFKTNDTFEEKEFTAHVFGDEQVIDAFNKFKNEIITEADMELSGSFAISNQAVKKQARIFKSVLKLDKNFHVYIHGNREMIEQGTDENGRKYYKLYYNEEQ